MTVSPNNQTASGRKLAIWGAWLQAAVPLGMIVSLAGMTGIFQSPKLSGGTVSPSDLAEDLSHTLTPSFIALVPASIGIVLVAIAAGPMRYRARWFFWFLVLYGGFWAISAPLGTVLGGGTALWAIWKRNEFLPGSRPSAIRRA